MIYRLVTLDQVRTQLNYDGTYADSQLQFRLDAVSGAIMDYIGPSSVALEGGTASAASRRVDPSGGPLCESLLVDSAGDPVLDSAGDFQFFIAPAQVDSSGDYV